MSRFAANPKWLIYLPPTMSPSETTKSDGLLEHPAEAFAYYRASGVPRSSSSRSTWARAPSSIVCRSNDVARERFGILEDEEGICYTRTGRRFFEDVALERELLASVRGCSGPQRFWDQLNTDWVCLDCELMPWSAKAQELVRQQYASVGTAAALAWERLSPRSSTRSGAGVDVGALAGASQRPAGPCRAVRSGVSALLLAGRIPARYPHRPVSRDGDRRRRAHGQGSCVAHDHDWQLRRSRWRLLMATPYREVDLADPASEAAATGWWTEFDRSGGEGAVVKPLSFVANGTRGLVQPAVKCRGREYLRIIYGPEYTLPDHLERLRERGLYGKRSLALREFALGIEGLERFVRREPLRRVHECVFGVLALESEPVDPRL